MSDRIGNPQDNPLHVEALRRMQVRAGQRWAHHSTGVYIVEGHDQGRILLRREEDRQPFNVESGYFHENFQPASVGHHKTLGNHDDRRQIGHEARAAYLLRQEAFGPFRGEQDCWDAAFEAGWLRACSMTPQHTHERARTDQEEER